jgi:hypothetical protein
LHIRECESDGWTRAAPAQLGASLGVHKADRPAIVDDLQIRTDREVVTLDPRRLDGGDYMTSTLASRGVRLRRRHRRHDGPMTMTYGDLVDRLVELGIAPPARRMEHAALLDEEVADVNGAVLADLGVAVYLEEHDLAVGSWPAMVLPAVRDALTRAGRTTSPRRCGPVVTTVFAARPNPRRWPRGEIGSRPTASRRGTIRCSGRIADGGSPPSSSSTSPASRALTSRS